MLSGGVKRDQWYEMYYKYKFERCCIQEDFRYFARL